MPNSFEYMPIEILMNVFSYLAVENLSTTARVNKKFNQLTDDQAFWEKKFRCHFPHIFKSMKTLYTNNWYAQFISTYQDEYKHCLLGHEEALNNGELGAIYTSFNIQ